MELTLRISKGHDVGVFDDSLASVSVQDAMSAGKLRIVGQSLWKLPTVLLCKSDCDRAGIAQGQPCKVAVSPSPAVLAKAWAVEGVNPGSCVAPIWLLPSGWATGGSKRLRLKPLLFRGQASAARLRSLPPAKSGGSHAVDVQQGPVLVAVGCVVSAAAESVSGAVEGGPTRCQVIGVAAEAARGAITAGDAAATSPLSTATDEGAFWVVQPRSSCRVRAEGSLPALPPTTRPALSGTADAGSVAALACLPQARLDVGRQLLRARGSAAADVARCEAAALVGAAARLGMVAVLASSRALLSGEAGGTEAAVARLLAAVSRGGAAASRGCAVGVLHHGELGAHSASRSGGLLARLTAAVEQGASPRQPGARPWLATALVTAAAPAHSLRASRCDRLAELVADSAAAAAAATRAGPSAAASSSASLPAPAGPGASLDFAGEAAFGEVVGQAAAKAALFNAVRLSSAASPGQHACTGVLLFGPPGCSKTMLARAVARSSGLAFLSVSGSSLLGKYVGDAERAVAALFRRARAAAPAVVFLDEADAIAASRDAGPTSSRKRLLNQLLQEMQGVQRVPPAQRVVVIAATNRPDVVDTALTRAGRLDRMVLVRPPSCAEGARILSAQLRLAPGGLDHDAVAARAAAGSNADQWAPMRSGADFAAVGRLARQLAAADAVEGAAAGLTEQHVAAAWARVQPSIAPAMLRFYTEFESKARLAAPGPIGV